MNLDGNYIMNNHTKENTVDNKYKIIKNYLSSSYNPT